MLLAYLTMDVDLRNVEGCKEEKIWADTQDQHVDNAGGWVRSCSSRENDVSLLVVP